MFDLNQKYSESGFFREVLFQPAMPSGKFAQITLIETFFTFFVLTGNSREDNELPVIYVTFMSSGDDGAFMDNGAVEE